MPRREFCGPVHVQGCWRTGEMWLAGELLNRPGERLSWGSSGYPTMYAAFLLLRRFVPAGEAKSLAPILRDEVLGQLGQDDFAFEFDFNRWVLEQRSRRLSRAIKNGVGLPGREETGT